MSTWQPAVQPGSILTTPPNRPYEPATRRRSWSPGAKILAAIVLVPILFGFVSNSSGGSYSGGESGTSIEMPMGGDMPPEFDPMSADPVTVELSADPSGVLPALAGKPKTVPVPAGATSLRVEVVSLPKADAEPPGDVLVQTFADDFAVDTSSSGLPFVATVHLNQRPSRLQVTAGVVSGTGRLQCRVYAGDRLVAVSTGGATVTCSPDL